MLQCLRQVFPNFPCLFPTFHPEYISVLSRFCHLKDHNSSLQMWYSINSFLCNNSYWFQHSCLSYYFTDCSTPPTLANTAVTYSGTKHGDTASYTCRQPYIKEGTGSGTITCQSGTWTSLDMTCVYGKTCSVSETKTGLVTTPSRTMIKWLFYT